jgi:hypothetical protein
VFATSLALPPSSLSDVVVDAETGDLFLPVLFANVILRVFATNGTARVIAGSGSPTCTARSIGDATTIGVPSASVALDGRGGLIIAEHACCLILRLNLSDSALSIISGDPMLFCDAPTEPEPPILPGSVEAPVSHVGDAGSIAVDRVSGDIFWAEPTASRVLVLRGGRGNALRIAGTGC